MSTQEGPLFLWDDFQTLELTVEGMNHTSQIPIAGGRPHALRIAELTETGAWVEMPSRSCAIGHAISLRILASLISERESEFETIPTPAVDPLENTVHFTAIVEAIEGEPNAISQQVLIRFRQHTPEEWTQLLHYFGRKQAKVNELLRRTRR